MNDCTGSRRRGAGGPAEGTAKKNSSSFVPVRVLDLDHGGAENLPRILEVRPQSVCQLQVLTVVDGLEMLQRVIGVFTILYKGNAGLCFENPFLLPQRASPIWM